MLRIIPLLSALVLSAVAVPAAADCTPVEATGGNVCVFASSVDSANAAVYQPGVASAWAYNSEYTFFGTTMKETGVFVNTEETLTGGASAYVTYFCYDFGSDDTCEYEDASAGLYWPGTTKGYVSVTSDYEGTTVCVANDNLPEAACTPLP